VGACGARADQEVIVMAVDTRQAGLSSPAYQAYVLLRTTFVVAPILFGVDKYFNFMVDWPKYLAPWIDDIMPGTAQQFMYVVGAVEILAGILVLAFPRWGSLVVAAWLGGIIVNLLTVNPPQYYDIALRDFGLMVGAVVLNRLAISFQVTRPAAEFQQRGNLAA
jgi:uncharacterized membrane protein YphA (DoxX/SURF4 family)